MNLTWYNVDAVLGSIWAPNKMQRLYHAYIIFCQIQFIQIHFMNKNYIFQTWAGHNRSKIWAKNPRQKKKEKKNRTTYGLMLASIFSKYKKATFDARISHFVHWFCFCLFFWRLSYFFHVFHPIMVLIQEYRFIIIMFKQQLFKIAPYMYSCMFKHILAP